MFARRIWRSGRKTQLRGPERHAQERSEHFRFTEKLWMGSRRRHKKETNSVVSNQ